MRHRYYLEYFFDEAIRKFDHRLIPLYNSYYNSHTEHTITVNFYTFKGRSRNYKCSFLLLRLLIRVALWYTLLQELFFLAIWDN